MAPLRAAALQAAPVLSGDPQHCFGRAWPFVPPSLRARAQKQVIAGGPRRLPLATHVEWTVRRTEIKDLVLWIFG